MLVSVDIRKAPRNRSGTPLYQAPFTRGHMANPQSTAESAAVNTDCPTCGPTITRLLETIERLREPTEMGQAKIEAREWLFLQFPDPGDKCSYNDLYAACEKTHHSWRTVKAVAKKLGWKMWAWRGMRGLEYIDKGWWMQRPEEATE